MRAKDRAVIEAFATAILDLHFMLCQALHSNSSYWDNRTADAVRAAVRIARMLTVKEEYR